MKIKFIREDESFYVCVCVYECIHHALNVKYVYTERWNLTFNIIINIARWKKQWFFVFRPQKYFALFRPVWKI